MREPLLTLYAVRNRSGEFFRAKGYGGCGHTWVPDLKKARIYPRPGPARTQVTFFANAYPKFGVPELVELRVTEVVALDETSRVQKSQDRKAKRDAKYAERQAVWEREIAQKKLEEAQAELRRLADLPSKVEARRIARSIQSELRVVQ